MFGHNSRRIPNPNDQRYKQIIRLTLYPTTLNFPFSLSICSTLISKDNYLENKKKIKIKKITNKSKRFTVSSV